MIKRVLIVEDHREFAEYVAAIIAPILTAFPGCEIEYTHDLDEALAIVARDPAPDFTLLDLGLPPYTMKDTLRHLDKFEARSPTVIITGNQPSIVERELQGRTPEIIYKPFRGDGGLLAAIVRAYRKFHSGKEATEQEDRFARLDALLDVHEG